MTLRSAMLSSAATLAILFSAAGAHAQQPSGFEPDERSNLAGGLHDAEQAAWNIELVHAITPPPGFFDPDALFRPAAMRAAFEAAQAAGEGPPVMAFTPLALANTDLAFSGGRVIVGNYNGFNIYDANVDGVPELALSVVCPGGQGDVSIHGDLLFVSVEQNRGRLDCGTSGAEGDVNPERFRGIRIFDISDFNTPRQIAAVQTCRGSHTHTLVPHPSDPDVLYIYNSGTSFVRETGELGICSPGQPDENPETALYSIDVIKVQLSAPEEAAIVNRPRIFADRDTGEIAGLWRGGAIGVASQRTAQTNHCHDITVYPELGIAAGACSGNGILLDISDPENPQRLSDLFDPDMAYWHSATFNNAGDTIVFTDEWGGGTQARCRAEDPANWGANLIATVEEGALRGQSFFKIPTAQDDTENCVAHNGSLIPVPGRDIMVQSWYQGGITVMDFTDPANPVEIAYFDRGPVDPEALVIAGYWSAYWYNGRIYGAEIARGLDVLRLTPSEHLSAAEIAAAERVVEDQVNPQTQTRIVWEDHPDVARSYLDQLARTEGLGADLESRARAAVDQWEQGRVSRRSMTRLTRDLASAAEGAEGRDQTRLTALAELLGRAR